MRKKMTARLFVLSTALVLPGLAAAQFPYSAWTCERSHQWCSPSLIPAEGEPIVWDQLPPGPGRGAVKPAFSDDAVNRFAAAFSEIKGISQGAQADIPQSATAEDTGKVRNQAHSQALQALESAKIDREEYNEIAAYMNRDMGLRMRVIGKMN